MFKAVRSPDKHRWIMVSGAPRSGTTFVGSILGIPRIVNTIYEPFNPNSGVAWNTTRYLYIDEDLKVLDPERKKQLEAFFAYKFTLKTVHSDRDSTAERLAKKVIGGGNQLELLKSRLNPFARVSLIKDPIAIFLAGIFAEMRGVQTIALIRHPLSFVGSLKRLNWRFKIAPILAQPDLRNRWAPELGDFDAEPEDWIVSSSWIWLVINRYILDIAMRRSEVHALTQEFLSENPDSVFRSLFHHFELPYSEHVSRRVIDLSSSGSGDSRPDVVHDFHRNSRKIFEASLSYLDPDEKARVLEICWPLASQIYVSEDQSDTRESFISEFSPKRPAPAASGPN